MTEKNNLKIKAKFMKSSEESSLKASQHILGTQENLGKGEELEEKKPVGIENYETVPCVDLSEKRATPKQRETSEGNPYDSETSRCDSEVSSGNGTTHPWLSLAFLALSVSLIVIDGTIINVALPQIVNDIGLSFSNAEWITTIYALVFSALLISVGRLADTYGRRNILVIGILLFIGASAWAGYTTNFSELLTARAIQGIGGACVLPTTLSTVNAIFQGKQRAIAFAVWGSVISGMAAVGPLLGGWLVSNYSWPWIFYINIPIGILLLLGIMLVVPNTKGQRSGNGIDVDGFLLSGIGLGTLVFGLIEGRTYGWWTPKEESDLILGLPISRAAIAIIIGICSLTLFIMWEKHRLHNGRSRLLDLRLFKIRTFTTGNIAAMMIALGEFGLLFCLPLYLQNVRGLSALEAGYILATMAVGAFIAGFLAGAISHKVDAAKLTRIGLLLEVIALLSLGIQLDNDTSMLEIASILVVYGIGLGIASAQLTSLILLEVPANQSGQGSATQSTARQIGAALGVAIIATFLAANVTSNTAGALDEIRQYHHLPVAVQTRIEKSVADSAGSSLVAIREGKGEFHKMERAERKKMVDALAEPFARATANAITLAGLSILIGLGSTVFLRGKTRQNR